MPKPAIFLDRDGTLIEERHYLSEPAQVSIFPGAIEALSQLSQAGYALVIVTNQSGIGRGLFTEDQLAIVHRHLEKSLADGGVSLDGIYHCPHAPDQACECRKPLPGLVRRACDDLGLDPARSWVIGDKPADVALGMNVGARPILVLTGYGESSRTAPEVAAASAHIAEDLPSATRFILDSH
ncbi:D-glycero-beta-D-manno-heptose 1,7-bisphosphate 7-phosphatase [bacterium]|nr:D-glycero-beta-D-manno-heptose 1,7-bisphosphate 7-phosphatase [bacterium]